MNEYSVVLFHSTNFAVWADKVFKREGLDSRLIPVPRHLSSDCGYSVRINEADTGRAKALMDKNGIEYDSIKSLSERGEP